MSTDTRTQHLTITRPDDWHLHVRDGDALATVVPHTAAQFGRAIIMPNLRPPVTTAAQALAYKARIQAAVPAGVSFEPLMTLYLTDNLPADEIRRAKDAGVVAAKLYPAGATTNSDAGVTDLRKTYATLEAMQKAGMLLLVHGEVTSPDIDLFDREAVFIDQQLMPLRRDFPELKIVFEHITTLEAAQYVLDADRFTGATITAHHLLYNRNAIFTGGIRPHYYCLPVLKREKHRLALVQAATGGNARFFLGTDSAPAASKASAYSSMAACAV
jgi:dihydroorotase